MSDDLIVTDIIEKDILSFDEVSRFPDIGFTGSLQKTMLGRDVPNPGIKVIEEDEGLQINCEIIVYYGVNIPQLCYDIQTKVKRDVETAADVTVKAVNIKVEGIDEPGESPQEDR